MGRPRKRRREDETDNSARLLVQEQDQLINVLSDPLDITNYPDYDNLISPPSLQDGCSSNESARHEAITPGQFDSGLSNQFDVLPAFDLAYVLSGCKSSTHAKAAQT